MTESLSKSRPWRWLILIVLRVSLDLFSVFLSSSHPPRPRLRERSERDKEPQIHALKQRVQSHKSPSRATHLCRSERRRVILLRFLVVHVHLGHNIDTICIPPSSLCYLSFPVHGIRYYLLRCRSRVRSVHTLSFSSQISPVPHTPIFFNHSNNLIILCDHIVSCLSIAEDHPELPLLTPLPF